MRTITLTEEQYSFLKECNLLLKTQDTRCTRNPIYTIHATKRIYGIDSEYSYNKVYIWDGDAYTKEELWNFFVSNGYEDDLLAWYNNNSGIYNSSETFEDCKEGIKNVFMDEDNLWDLEEFLSEKFDIQITYYFDEDQQITNGTCFSFFEQDAFDHIKMNKHNISGEKVHTYADSLYRAPKMEKLLELLKELSFENYNDDYCEDLVHKSECV